MGLCASCAQQEGDDSVSLFNGKDLEGWEGDAALWEARDGAMVGQTTAENPMTADALGEDLPTVIVPSEMKVAEGFEVELVYTVPKEEQGSWVGLTVDGRGRLIACDQYGGLYRVTLPAVAEVEEAQVERLELEGSAGIGGEAGSNFGAHGVLYAFDSL